MRKIAIIAWLFGLSVAIIALFWRIEWVYSQPTPVPKYYRDVPTGQQPGITAIVSSKNGRPLLLHFFNPDCPCSKFNVTHFKALVKQYGKEVDFAIVPVTKKKYTTTEIQDLFQLKLTVIQDTSLAAKCGVYSTPQAVIIDAGQSLYYRGNYNKSRYCADKKSSYAMMALDSLLAQRTYPVFSRFALKAYGCKIPGQ